MLVLPRTSGQNALVATILQLSGHDTCTVNIFSSDKLVTIEYLHFLFERKNQQGYLGILDINMISFKNKIAEIFIIGKQLSVLGSNLKVFMIKTHLGYMLYVFVCC